jgi:hypothetical protein
MEHTTLKPLVGVAMLLAVAPLGLPFENTWFAGFVAGVTFCGFFTAAVVSSAFYIWAYRFGHSMFHLGTAYFAHPSVWRYFKDPRGSRREEL